MIKTCDIIVNNILQYIKSIPGSPLRWAQRGAHYLKLQIMRIWEVGIRIPDRINITFREDFEILTAIVEKDESLAERRMKEHISNAFKDYIKVTLLDEAGIQDIPGKRANKKTGS